jgi:hypothetical protein
LFSTVSLSPCQPVNKKADTQALNVAYPTQTYFIPMPEEQSLKDMFKVLHNADVTKDEENPPVTTVVGIATSVDGTIITVGTWLLSVQIVYGRTKRHSSFLVFFYRSLGGRI